jgi:Ca-activated chloride channel family protein
MRNEEVHMRSFLAGVVVCVGVVLAAGSAAAADRAIIVLDGSGSMWGQIGGKPKLEIARETLRTVLGSVPSEMELGLMAYGHRQKGACTDIELIVQPAAGTGGAIADAADKMRFLGMTPLSEAVRLAAEELRYTEEKATVIVITDGIETCEADPCALAHELEQSGIDFTAHVVGFGLSDEEGRKVACLAEITGGKFIQAKDASSLDEALTQTVAAAPEPQPEQEPQPQPEPEPAVVENNFAPTLALSEDTDDLGDAGQSWHIFKALPDGGEGERVRTEYNEWTGHLEPGKYLVKAELGRASTTQLVTIEEGKTADPHFILNAGIVAIRPLPAPGEAPSSGATLRFKHSNGDFTEYGETRVYVPAGEVTLDVGIGHAKMTETLDVKAGRTLEKDIVVGVGRAVFNAYYIEGMKVDVGGLASRVFKGAKKIDGTRESVTVEYGPDTKADLSPGEYVLASEYQGASAEAPFTVKVGELVDVATVLNAGVLAIAAPEASRVLIHKAGKDIQGNRKTVTTEYNTEFQYTLTAGDYVVEASYSDDRSPAEKSVSVTAGERVEIAVP